MPTQRNRKINRSKLPATQSHSSAASSEVEEESNTTSPLSSESSRSWQYPPEFWDRLSKVPLCRQALDELDRRARPRSLCPSPAPLLPKLLAEQFVKSITPAETRLGDVPRFARHGGPDLGDLRGYSSHFKVQSTPEESGTMRASHPGFEQHLFDHGMRPIFYSQTPNLEEERVTLANRRPSLTPSQFSEGTFRAFQEGNDQARDEADVFVNVIPVITGTREANDESAMNVLFRNLAPLTDGTIAAPKPDLYYGSIPSQVHPTIRKELGDQIAPSAASRRPIVPNFFLEVDGPHGVPGLMIQKICCDGAVGTRAMHSLQNYREKEPTYNDQARTYSSTYQNGHLQLYAHHATAAPGEQPEYHTTRICGYSMTNSRETFLEGAAAFRNTRDLAKKHRDSFIRHANSKVQAGTTEVRESTREEQEMRQHVQELCRTCSKSCEHALDCSEASTQNDDNGVSWP